MALKLFLIAQYAGQSIEVVGVSLGLSALLLSSQTGRASFHVVDAARKHATNVCAVRRAFVKDCSNAAGTTGAAA